MTYALTRLLETNKACEKCAALIRNSDKYRQVDASYILSDSDNEWLLCTNHAAAACHSLGVKHKVFNPGGAVSK